MIILNDIFKILVSLSISGTIIALILFAFKLLTKNKFSKTWHYYIWLVVIIRLMMPFALPINMISEILYFTTQQEVINEITPAKSGNTDINTGVILPNENVGIQDSEIHNQQLKPEIETTVDEMPALYVEKEALYDFQQLLPYVSLLWLIVCILLFARKIVSYYSFIRFVKKGSKVIEDDTIIEIYTTTCESSGMKKLIPLYSNNIIVSPMCIGFFKPYIVLPDKQLENTSQLHHIFRHELTHYKRFDIYYKWLVQTAICIHWFNPIVYFISKEVNKYCELSCDEAVIKKLDAADQRAYGDTLLRSLELGGSYSNTVVSLTLAENSKLMKERLGAIMKFHKKSKLAACVSALLTFILCTGAAFTGVQAETIDNNKEAIASDITNSSAVTASDLQNIQPIPYTTIGARAYSYRWASAAGIEGDTYQKQLDEKIKWTEDLYKEKKERFMLNETISEEEITNTLGIQYMYEKSSVYREMANVGATMQSSPTVNIGGSFQFLPYDSSFSRSGSKKYYERSVFYVDQSATMNLSVSYDLTDGKIGFMVISPEGKVVCSGETLSHYSNTITFPVNKGLWSLVIVNESETGAIKGTQKIEGIFTSTENFIVPIDISELKAKESTTYGPFYLNELQLVSVDIERWNGSGDLFVAEVNEGEALHSATIKKSPGQFAFLTGDLRNYYITVRNESNVALTDIKGKLTLNLKQTPPSRKIDATQKQNVDNSTNKIAIDIKSLASNQYIDLGEYTLSTGDSINFDIDATGKGLSVGFVKDTDSIATAKSTYFPQTVFGENAVIKNSNVYVPLELAGKYKLYVRNVGDKPLANIKGFVEIVETTQAKTEEKVQETENLTDISYKLLEIDAPSKANALQTSAATIIGDYFYFAYGPYYVGNNEGEVIFDVKNGVKGSLFIATSPNKELTKGVTNTFTTDPMYKGAMGIFADEDGYYYVIIGAKDIKDLKGSIQVPIFKPQEMTDNVANEGNTVINLKNKNTYNIAESGSFQAVGGQILTLNIVSSIKGGTIDLFLFDPNGKEQRITIGSSNSTKEVKLSKGTWSYNCSGIFKDGGNIQITGKIE